MAAKTTPKKTAAKPNAKLPEPYARGPLTFEQLPTLFKALQQLPKANDIAGLNGYVGMLGDAIRVLSSTIEIALEGK